MAMICSGLLEHLHDARAVQRDVRLEPAPVQLAGLQRVLDSFRDVVVLLARREAHEDLLGDQRVQHG